MTCLGRFFICGSLLYISSNLIFFQTVTSTFIRSDDMLYLNSYTLWCQLLGGKYHIYVHRWQLNGQNHQFRHVFQNGITISWQNLKFLNKQIFLAGSFLLPSLWFLLFSQSLLSWIHTTELLITHLQGWCLFIHANAYVHTRAHLRRNEAPVK